MAIKKLSKTEKKHTYDKKLCQLLDEYSMVLVAQADNVSSTQLAAVHRGIRSELVMLMGKNTLIRRCIKAHADRTDNENIKAIIPLLKGSIGLIFTKGDLKEVREEAAKYKAAIRCAKGQCKAFYARFAANDDVLKFLSHEAPFLKSLRLISCPRILEFEECIKKLPCLKDLELSFIKFGEPGVLKKIGEVCPEMKHFRLNAAHFFDVHKGSADKFERDANAEGITSMRGLRSLQMFGNNLSNVGLTHIIDHCSHLEYLDIKNCYNISLNDKFVATRTSKARIFCVYSASPWIIS